MTPRTNACKLMWMPQTCYSVSLHPRPNPIPSPQFNEFATSVPQPWVNYPKRKAFTGDGFPPHFPTAAALPPPGPQFHGQKAFRSHRPSLSFSGPRVDKYHWVSKSRS